MKYDKKTGPGKSSGASSSRRNSRAPQRPSGISSQSKDADELVAHLFRHHGVRIVATLTRVFGAEHLSLAEDVVQDALVKALQQWPFRGIPENPAGWLTLVARNRALDLLRRDASLSDKIAELERVMPHTADAAPQTEIDDQLSLILMCCHPALSSELQIALTLKSVCGFSTAEIARAFLTEESAISQRVVRAKRRLREKKIAFELPDDKDAVRLDAVMSVIYLLFNEGYGATRGDDLVRPDLCEEAIRLATLLTTHERGRSPEGHALLALMMLQAARLPARLQSDGKIALLAEQDRKLWDRRLIASGLRQLCFAAEGNKITSYHLQAEIAAVHAMSANEVETDWQKIVELYDELYELEPTPIVALNRAVAMSRWQGPQVAIQTLEELGKVRALRGYHLLPAVLGELWQQAGDFDRAANAYRKALKCRCTEPERRFLESQLETVDGKLQNRDR